MRNPLFLLFLLCCFCQAGEPPSVYEISPYLDGGIIIGGALITGYAYACADSLTNRRCPCNPQEVNSFDRPSIGNNSATARTVSDLLVGASVVGPVVFDWADIGWNKALLEDTVVLGEVLAVNSALVTIVKFTVQRPTPLAYSGQDARKNDGYDAFYSGHTSTLVSSLAAASITLNLRHHYGAFPWIATGVLGTTVALLRVAGGSHFYSDVIVGGLVGAGVGILVPWLHEKKIADGNLSLAPIGANGLALNFYRVF